MPPSYDYIGIVRPPPVVSRASEQIIPTSAHSSLSSPPWEPEQNPSYPTGERMGWLGLIQGQNCRDNVYIAAEANQFLTDSPSCRTVTPFPRRGEPIHRAMSADSVPGKTVLVTGEAGFIGSHLVEELVHTAGEVRVLDETLRLTARTAARRDLVVRGGRQLTVSS